MPGGGKRPEQERAISFRFILSFGAFGSGPGAFVDPHGISVDRLGRVYVADTGNDRIQKFDEDGRFLDEIGGFGWDADQFNRPTDVYARDALEIYVADAGNRRIQRFDSRFNLLESITHFEEEEFGDLMSLAVSPTGDLYVTDLHRDEVIRLSPFDDEARIFGGSEIGGDGWFRPWGLAVDGERAIYVSEPGNARIVRFDPFGNLNDVWYCVKCIGMVSSVGGGGFTRSPEVVDGYTKLFHDIFGGPLSEFAEEGSDGSLSGWHARSAVAQYHQHSLCIPNDCDYGFLHYAKLAFRSCPCCHRVIVTRRITSRCS